MYVEVDTSPELERNIFSPGTCTHANISLTQLVLGYACLPISFRVMSLAQTRDGHAMKALLKRTAESSDCADQ